MNNVDIINTIIEAMFKLLLNKFGSDLIHEIAKTKNGKAFINELVKMYNKKGADMDEMD